MNVSIFHHQIGICRWTMVLVVMAAVTTATTVTVTAAVVMVMMTTIHCPNGTIDIHRIGKDSVDSAS